jgi:hypothetical protein
MSAHIDNLKNWFIILTGIIISRVIIFQIYEIEARSDVIVEHMQNLQLSALNEKLISSLFNLHSQPPLWNFLLGIGSKVCSADAVCIANVGHIFYVGLTFVTCCLMHKVLRIFDFGNTTALSASIIYSIIPSVIYYENYIFYPHITMIVFSVCCVFSYFYFSSKRLIHLVAALSALACLSLTWSLFHPIGIIVIGSVFLIRGVLDRQTVAIFLIFMVVCLAPAVKNSMYFGFFGSGSWMGLNLSQVAPGANPSCKFNDFRIQLKASDPSFVHNGTIFNDPSIIPYSKACLKTAYQNIVDHPKQYIKNRLLQVFSSLQKSPSDYFFPPKNFVNYPNFSYRPVLRDADGSHTWSWVAKRAAVFSFNVLSISILLAGTFFARDKNFRDTLLIVSLISIMLLGLGYGANGAEQERMRYTLNFAIFITTVVVIRYLGIRIKMLVSGVGNQPAGA